MGGPEGLLPFFDPAEEGVSGGVAAESPAYEDWIVDEMSRAGARLARMVFELDLLIAEYRALLVKAQPSIEGKIDLRWWRHKSKPGRAPYAFKWKQTARGWTADRLPEGNLTVRAGRKGRFYRTSGLVKAVLGELQVLMTRREAVLSAMGRARGAVTQRVSKNQEWIEERAGHLEVLKREVESHPEVCRMEEARKEKRSG